MSTVRTAPIPMLDAGHAQISQQLRGRLLALDYPDFARCVCRLLESLGYGDARPAGRDEWKGYNRPGGGGWDVEATLPGGIAPRRVIAQIKQYGGLNVHQRSVDELRGACLRAWASEGLLVTTSGFSRVVREAALSLAPAGTVIAPIRLIDGEDLAALMVRHRVGVRERSLSRRSFIGKRRSDTDGLDRLEIDEAFFAGVADPEMARRYRNDRPTPPELRVSIRILSLPRAEKMPEAVLGPKGGR